MLLALNYMLVEFCLPILNEEQMLEKSVLKLLQYCEKENFDFDWRIMILSNGSTDRSLEIAKELHEKYKDRIDFKDIKERGRGNALKIYWNDSKTDVCAYMDIDLSVALDSVSELVYPIIKEDYDLVIGSRMVPGAKVTRSFFREIVSRGYNLLSKAILLHGRSDMQCGFKAVKVDSFKKISQHIKDPKWFFDTELIFFSEKYGYKIKEIPVNWSENRYEKRKSKVNVMRDSIKFFCDLIKLRLRIRG